MRVHVSQAEAILSGARSTGSTVDTTVLADENVQREWRRLRGLDEPAPDATEAPSDKRAALSDDPCPICADDFKVALSAGHSHCLSIGRRTGVRLSKVSLGDFGGSAVTFCIACIVVGVAGPRHQWLAGMAVPWLPSCQVLDTIGKRCTGAQHGTPLSGYQC
jgi:hypothetical protein